MAAAWARRGQGGWTWPTGWWPTTCAPWPCASPTASIQACREQSESHMGRPTVQPSLGAVATVSLPLCQVGSEEDSAAGGPFLQRGSPGPPRNAGQPGSHRGPHAGELHFPSGLSSLKTQPSPHCCCVLAGGRLSGAPQGGRHGELARLPWRRTCPQQPSSTRLCLCCLSSSTLCVGVAAAAADTPPT